VQPWARRSLLFSATSKGPCHCMVVCNRTEAPVADISTLQQFGTCGVDDMFTHSSSRTFHTQSARNHTYAHLSAAQHAANAPAPLQIRYTTKNAVPPWNPYMDHHHHMDHHMDHGYMYQTLVLERAQRPNRPGSCTRLCSNPTNAAFQPTQP
jgi:hypothetical protein